jgi:hypothetical protein
LFVSGVEHRKVFGSIFDNRITHIESQPVVVTFLREAAGDTSRRKWCGLLSL